MLQMDTTSYPLAVKWRKLSVFFTDDPNPDIDHQIAVFSKTVAPMYGPHQDPFEWTALKQERLQDSKWVGNRDAMHLFHGFGFFHPPTLIRALEFGCEWQSSDIENWKLAEQKAGTWILFSSGPDLIA